MQTIDITNYENFSQEEIRNFFLGIDETLIDLNSPKHIYPENWDWEDFEETVPADVYLKLPEMLRRPFEAMGEEDYPKDLVLNALLTVASGCFTNYLGYYDGKMLTPHLFLSVIAPFGSGKGILEWIGKIWLAIHRRELDESREKIKRAKIRKKLKQQKAEEKGLDLIDDDDDNKPVLKCFQIPGDNTKAGMIRQLEMNGGEGVMFETELDTLSVAMGKDVGQFTDILRKAFHKETISNFRKTDNEYTYIESPKLAIVLSGTKDQMTKFLSIGNGLFSRFINIQIKGSGRFRNVFSKEKVGYNDFFEAYATEFALINKELSYRSGNEVIFSLQRHQEEKFVKLFDTLKVKLIEDQGEDFDGIVNRLGLIAFRIAAILTACRQFTAMFIPDQVVCEDEDFFSALEIIKVISKHTIVMYNEFERKEKPSVEDGDKTTPEQIREVWRLHDEGLTIRQIAEQVFSDVKKKGRVERILKGPRPF